MCSHLSCLANSWTFACMLFVWLDQRMMDDQRSTLWLPAVAVLHSALCGELLSNPNEGYLVVVKGIADSHHFAPLARQQVGNFWQPVIIQPPQLNLQKAPQIAHPYFVFLFCTQHTTQTLCQVALVSPLLVSNGGDKSIITAYSTLSYGNKTKCKHSAHEHAKMCTSSTDSCMPMVLEPLPC